MKEEAGKVIGLVGVMMDITDRKKAEQEVRLTRSRLESTLAANEIGTWEYDIVRNQVLADANLERMFSVSAEEARGGPLDAYLKVVHEEDRERLIQQITDAIQFRDQLGDRVPHPARWGYPMGRRSRSGGTRREWCCVEASRGVGRCDRTTIGRVPRKIIVGGNGIRQCEVSSIFEQGAIFACLLDCEGLVLESNHLSLEGCGYSREAVIGKPFRECPWWTRSAAIVETIVAGISAAQSGSVFRTETPYFTFDGVERYVDLFILPIKDSTGKTVFLAATGADITLQRRNEEALKNRKGFSGLRWTPYRATSRYLMTLARSSKSTKRGDDLLNKIYMPMRVLGVGTNYLEVSEQWHGDCGDGSEVARGIREVMSGERERYSIEYPCHSPTEQRWFLMHATRFHSPGPVRIVVAHYNVNRTTGSSRSVTRSRSSKE